MIFAEKLIQLRKKSGWSQEELASQMDVTRQSVSKWESAQSVPDLEKILRLSELFEVSLDYLLKDEVEEAEVLNLPQDKPCGRQVTLEEANRFLSAKRDTSGKVAIGVFLCVISPICLLVLGAVSEYTKSGLSEYAAGGIGMIALLALVAVAVGIFISAGSKTAPFSYMDTEDFETEYGVTGMVKDRKEKYKNRHTKNNIIGASLCILSLIPLFGTMVFKVEHELLLIVMLSAGIFIAGIGVFLFVRVGIVWASFERLLQEGEYSKSHKKVRTAVSMVSTVYWVATTAIFLAYSLATNNWGYSWIIWVVAGVLSPAVLGITHVMLEKREER